MRMAHGWNMTDRKTLSEPNETPEDVATLYSWANLHGAKYRDFSASRAQTREKARQRVQDAIAEERDRAHDQADGPGAADAQRAAEAARQAEFAAQSAQRTVQQSVQNSVQNSAQRPGQQPGQNSGPQAGPQNGWQQAEANRYAGFATTAPVSTPNPSQPEFRSGNPAFQGLRTTAPPNVPRMAPVREDSRAYGAQAEARDDFGRPAWLTPTRPEPAAQPVQQAPEDTLQGSRDRMTARWFALKGVFEGSGQAAPEVAQAPAGSRAPVLAVFSLAGGVGKTSLVATLARALASRGERVLLVDTADFGLLPFFFGARDQRPGVLRTFSPPGSSGDAPIQLVSVDTESFGPESAQQETLTEEILRHARGANRVLIDLATASAGTTRRVLRLAPSVLVPVIPDMSSVVSVGSIDEFFRRHPGPNGRPVQPYYLLNQFDHTLPLHLDVREVLREQVGDRLLSFVMRRSPAVSEAMAEGMTVMDYAPNSTVAEDFVSLAGWTKTVAAPVSSSYRGVRWSER
jgi:cellulose synthase operon protein YhjQ